MKQFLLLIAFIISMSSVQAQSAEETLEWLNIKKIDVSIAGSTSSTVTYPDSLLLTADHIRMAKKDGSWTQGGWSYIKEIKLGSYDAQIVFSNMYNNKPIFINIRIYDLELLKKYIKALKHMATLKGAKMIDSDLF